MNPTRRSFVAGTVTLLASTTLTPYTAFAAKGVGITAMIAASFVNGTGGKGQNVNDRLEIGPRDAGKLQEMNGAKRAAFLSDLILRWLKKRFPDVPWPKIGNDVSNELSRQVMSQLERNGAGSGGKPIPTKIKVRIKFKFKPPSDWEISIEINF